MKKILLVLCAVISVFTACQKTTDLPPVEALKSISLGRDTLTMRTGQTFQLNITTTPDGRSKEVTLSSSDSTIVSVKSDGKLTAKKNGTAVITATNQLKTISVTCLVTVLDLADPLKGILFTDTLSIYEGDVVQLHYTTTPPNYDQSLLVWTSSDTTVLTVSGVGKVTAKNEGVSTVTLTNKAKSFSLSGIVAVKSKLYVGLLAYYPFNNNTADYSGNNNNGAAYNLTSSPDRFGKPNSAYSFNGFNSYVKVNDNTALRLNNTDFTLSAWVKLGDYNSSYGSAVLLKRLTDADNGWNFSISGYAAYTKGLVTFGPGGGSNNAFGTTAVGIGTWNMITCVYNLQNRQVSIYVNGVLDQIVNGILSPNPNISSPMYFGKDDPSVPANGYFFQGSMDDIRIYNRGLSAAEVKKLYNLKY